LIRDILLQTTTRQTSTDGATFMAWVIAFLIAGAVLFLVVRPLLEVAPATAKPKSRSNPHAEQEALLENLYERLAVTEKSLEELDYDKEYGALTESDYQDLKERYSDKLTSIRVEITQTERLVQERREKSNIKRVATKAKTETANGKIREEVKKIITNPATLLASKKEDKFTPVCTECATPFKPGEKYCGNCQAPLPLVCFECGSDLETSHKFCPECGKPVK
jgi:NADH pyrophosphatase NudC (nudix superfamily)